MKRQNILWAVLEAQLAVISHKGLLDRVTVQAFI